MTAAFSLQPLNVLRVDYKATDAWLLCAFIALMILGGVMMVSASIAYAEGNYGDPLFHLYRHLFYVAAGLLAAMVCLLLPMQFWQRWSAVFLLFAVVLLALVLVPGIGRTVNGSQRWIPLGPINLQVSELAKLFALIFLSGYLVRRADEVRHRWRGFLKPMMVFALLAALLLAEPDFGAVVVLMGSSFGMMFLAGARLDQFVLMFCGASAGAAFIAYTSPYRWQRLTSFVDAWDDPYGTDYQLVQSLIAIGRGEWFGVGLGNSVQKLFYLPEAHTDFVFAILAEELGLLGALCVIALFGILIWRILAVGREAVKKERMFSGYLCYGLALVFASQVFINIGVNSGLLPTKGLTLPFFSYGGSSLVVCCVMVALVLRVHYETANGVKPVKTSKSKKKKEAKRRG